MYRHKIIAAIVSILIVIYTYQVSRPTVIIHTEYKTGYLGKLSEIDGNIENLFIENYKVSYKLPHSWQWEENDEIAIFTPNFNDILRKNNIDFWHLDIYLDEVGKYKYHTKSKLLW